MSKDKMINPYATNQKDMSSELLFRTKFSFGGEVKLVRKGSTFIVERVGVTGKHAAQYDHYDTPEAGYAAYENNVSLFQEFVVS